MENIQKQLFTEPEMSSYELVFNKETGSNWENYFFFQSTVVHFVLHPTQTNPTNTVMSQI